MEFCVNYTGLALAEFTCALDDKLFRVGNYPIVMNSEQCHKLGGGFHLSPTLLSL